MKTSPPYDKRTRTYKTHNDTPISLDIYLPLSARKDAGSNPPPILIFFHGGYLVRVRSLQSLLALSCAGQIRNVIEH
jgi:acetyl esterase/lipase